MAKCRCTWSDGKGSWGIKGVDLSTLPPNAYGALCKLHEMERLADAIQHEADPVCASDLLAELLGLLGLHGSEVRHAED